MSGQIRVVHSQIDLVLIDKDHELSTVVKVSYWQPDFSITTIQVKMRGEYVNIRRKYAEPKTRKK